MSKLFVVFGLVALVMCGVSAQESDDGLTIEEQPSPNPLESAPKIPPHYDYGEGASGQKHWANLDPRFAACAFRSSPISIRNSYIDKKLEALDFDYVPTEIDLEVREKTLRWLFPPDTRNQLIANGQKYRLREIVVHTPSEHLLHGIRFPLELQFLHETIIPENLDPVQAKKLYKVLAVSVLGLSGSHDHSGLDKFMLGVRTDTDADMWKKGYNATEGPLEHVFDLPPARITTLASGVESVFTFGDKSERRQSGASMNPADLLPQRRSYYRYQGQLTFPPCTLNTDWYVMASEIQIKTSHARRFFYETGPNARLANELATGPRIAKYLDPKDKDTATTTVEKELIPGPRGDRGPAGDKGLLGAEGDIGPRGPRGEPGRDAQDGAKGAIGPDGPRGPQGKKGPVGPGGVKGVNGDDGDEGDRGVPGRDGTPGRAIPGPVGPPGPRGEAIVGDDGPAGPQGDEGLPGKKGVPGQKGFRGAKGKSIGGEQGPRGEQGPAGDEGEQGSKGEQGDKGKTGPRGKVGPRGRAGAAGPAGPEGPVNAEEWQPFSLLAQVEAQSYCVGFAQKSRKAGWVFAVGRDNQTGGRTCEEICENSYEAQAGTLYCGLAILVGENGPAAAVGKRGLVTNSFTSCDTHKAGGGPNYCCCFSKKQ